MALKYGPKFESGPRPLYLPVEASQKFHEQGNAFVTSTAGTGHLGLSLTADTTIFGWLLTGFSPRAPEVSGSLGSYVFTTSSTAGTRYLVKPLDPSEVFYVKADAVFAEAMRGDACDLIGVNDGTAQTADVGTSTTDVLRILDGVVGVADVLVAVNPSKLDATT